MSGLDGEALSAVHEIVKARIRRQEIAKRNAPVREAIWSSRPDYGTSELIASAGKISLTALESFERSVAEFPERLANADSERARRLASIRRRTQALQAWLESLP